MSSINTRALPPCSTSAVTGRRGSSGTTSTTTRPTRRERVCHEVFYGCRCQTFTDGDLATAFGTRCVAPTRCGAGCTGIRRVTRIVTGLSRQRTAIISIRFFSFTDGCCSCVSRVARDGADIKVCRLSLEGVVKHRLSSKDIIGCIRK